MLLFRLHALWGTQEAVLFRLHAPWVRFRLAFGLTLLFRLQVLVTQAMLFRLHLLWVRLEVNLDGQ